MSKATKKKILETLLVIVVLIIGYFLKEKLGIGEEDTNPAQSVEITQNNENQTNSGDLDTGNVNSTEQNDEKQDSQSTEGENEAKSTEAPESTEEVKVTETPSPTEEVKPTEAPTKVPEPTATPKPTATPTPEPEQTGVEIKYHFRNESYMTQHFEKHGGEFDYDSVEEYLEGANRVVQSKDALHKLEAEDGDDIYYLEATNEFVVVSKDGYLRTYFKPSAGKKYYDRQ